MKIRIACILFLIILSCKEEKATDARTPISKSETVIDSTSSAQNDLEAIATKDFREFLVLDSKNLTKASIWEAINPQLNDFSEADYNRLKPLIIEQDIMTLQNHIDDGKLTYELLTKFYLYRIRKYDRENKLSVNSVIAINPNVIEAAKQHDAKKNSKSHPIYGMPILLKDNINAEGMATTAGALALQNNYAEDAFIVKQLKSKGALILGKANLSEWAYFFCGDCPSGYSALGGQTLNPYGRRIFDTGGSSSGSGVAVASNFCAAAIGSETAGSILSPASQNSVVGLKPTVGLVSRSGIVPISSTLDTAGPMTKTVVDNAIVLDAIFGEDQTDFKSIRALWSSGFYYKDLNKTSLKGFSFGAPKRLMKDSLFATAVAQLKEQGAKIVELEEKEVALPNFIRLLNLDMKKDLPKYIDDFANVDTPIRTIEDVIRFNKNDSLRTMPYGQKLFVGIADDQGDERFLEQIKDTLKRSGQLFFDEPMKSYNLDGFLSINNYHAAYAAVAEYPAITVPMGYTKDGEPKGLTIIASRLKEKQLLTWAYAYEHLAKARRTPSDYN